MFGGEIFCIFEEACFHNDSTNIYEYSIGLEFDAIYGSYSSLDLHNMKQEANVL